MASGSGVEIAGGGPASDVGGFGGGTGGVNGGALAQLKTFMQDPKNVQMLGQIMQQVGRLKDTVGKLMRRGSVDETLHYFDDFYKVINNQREAKSSIIESCLSVKK